MAMNTTGKSVFVFIANVAPAVTLSRFSVAEHYAGLCGTARDDNSDGWYRQNRVKVRDFTALHPLRGGWLLHGFS